MKTRSVRIGKRNFALLFNYQALADIIDGIPGFDLGDIVAYVRSPRNFPLIVWAMAKAGEEEEGRTLDVDAAWFAHHLRPSPVAILKVQTAVNEALTDGMTMESEEEDEDAEVDVTLEDLKKKGPPDGSPSGS